MRFLKCIALAALTLAMTAGERRPRPDVDLLCPEPPGTGVFRNTLELEPEQSPSHRDESLHLAVERLFVAELPIEAFKNNIAWRAPLGCLDT